MQYINNVIYGNPTIEQLPYLQRASPLDHIIEDTAFMGCPLNAAAETVKELKELSTKTRQLQTVESMREHYTSYDRDMVQYFKKGLMLAGVNDETMAILLENLIEDTFPIIIKLKYKYQRPRPYQLAAYHNIPLYYFSSYSADSPSFPSGHAFLGTVICGVIGKLFPNISIHMHRLSHDFNESRMYLGLHFKTDIEAGVIFGNLVLQDKWLKNKYKIL